MAKHPSRLAVLASGAFDGEICLWDLVTRKCTRQFIAHEGWVRSICFTPNGKTFTSVGDDKTIKTWKAEVQDEEDEDPVSTLLSMSVVSGITHHRSKPLFATCGEHCQLWENTRNEPIKVFKWGVDSLQHVSFNQVGNFQIPCQLVWIYLSDVVKAIFQLLVTLIVNKIHEAKEIFSLGNAESEWNVDWVHLQIQHISVTTIWH